MAEKRGERKLAEQVAARLRQAGFRALFAGGSVRDLLLGGTPLDWDIATSARPEQVQMLFPHTVAVGASFGVMLVLPDGKTPIEVATFRRDLGYTDRRRPDAIEFCDERVDAERRDFTVNGLFLDPVSGEVLDYVGGRADLGARRLRAIGNPTERIAEDRLRMLRAVRFAARLEFAIDRGLMEALRLHASSIVEVSAERVRDELVKMLTGRNAAVALELLAETGLLRAALPEVAALESGLGGAWARTLVRLAGLERASTALALATLLLDLPAEGAERVISRLRLSGAEQTRTRKILAAQPAIEAAPGLGEAALRRLLREPGCREALELQRLAAIAGASDLTGWRRCHQRLAALSEPELWPEPLLTGRHLIEQGLLPGPAFKEILTALEDAQLAGSIRSPEQAQEWLRARLAARREA